MCLPDEPEHPLCIIFNHLPCRFFQLPAPLSLQGFVYIFSRGQINATPQFIHQSNLLVKFSPMANLLWRFARSYSPHCLRANRYVPLVSCWVCASMSFEFYFPISKILITPEVQVRPLARRCTAKSTSTTTYRGPILLFFQMSVRFLIYCPGALSNGKYV